MAVPLQSGRRDPSERVHTLWGMAVLWQHNISDQIPVAVFPEVQGSPYRRMGKVCIVAEARELLQGSMGSGEFHSAAHAGSFSSRHLGPKRYRCLQHGSGRQSRSRGCLQQWFGQAGPRSNLCSNWCGEGAVSLETPSNHCEFRLRHPQSSVRFA